MGEESLLWSVAPETQMRVARAKWDVIITYCGHGNARIKDSGWVGGRCVCLWVCTCAWATQCLCAKAHLPFVLEEDWEYGSSVNAKAEVEWRYQQSLVSTSPATGGSFIFIVHSLSLILPNNHEYGCLCRVFGSNGWNREKQLSAVLMSSNIVIAILALCICMTYFGS